MIQPLSFRRRAFYLSVFVILFVVLVPIIILYSTGYRLGKDFSLEQTGGIYVYSGESGTSIYVNNDLERETNPFQRGVFVSNLAPSAYYTVKVVKDGRYTWTKDVPVFPEQVTEAYPFLPPLDPTMATVTPSILNASGSKATNTDYKTASALFAAKPASSIKPFLATSTGNGATSSLVYQLTRRNIALWKNGNDIVADWLGNTGDTPFYFCGSVNTISSCASELAVYKDATLGTFDFYPGRNDVVIFSDANGIYATELDTREPQNVVPLVVGPKLDFRVENGENLFVKKGNYLYKVEL